MNIGFYQPHLDLWGTGTACFDFASLNQTILKNTSAIFYDRNNNTTHPSVLLKFQQAGLQLVPIEGDININNLNKACKDLNIDAVYIHKTGTIDNRYTNDIPTFIHACGVVNQPHGTVYAYVSKWLSQHCSGDTLPFVPLIVNLPNIDNDLREEYGIPKHSVVLGRTGGPYSWNISFVNSVISDILKKRQDIYFIFLNTDKFIDHERVIFFEPFADLNQKRKFINTCDAMIHARAEGESFGLSCAEFSTCNKPVITYFGSPERNHIHTLKDRGIYYDSYDSLYRVFEKFVPNKDLNWNMYQDSEPFNGIMKFKKVFIDAL